MSCNKNLGRAIAVTVFLAAMASAAARADTPLAGTWTLVAADVQHPDGSRGRDYGASPKGILLVDEQGNYSLQIYKSERPRFVSDDKGAATAAEFKAAVTGSSTHYGKLSVDAAQGTLTFQIQGASFPNWEGALQKRRYELKGDQLSYFVTARPNGDLPISVWQRVH